MNRKELIEYKKNLNLSHFQKQVLIGTLLGDATIPKQQLNQTHNIKFEQSIVREKYIIKLFEIFNEFVGTGPKPRDIKGGNARDRQSVWFRTYKHIEFTRLYNLFYLNGKKVIPKEYLEEYFSEVSLAFWFMDDGSKTHSGYVLNTYCFTYDENIFLSELLVRRFGLKATLHKDGKDYRIYINASSVSKFNSLVKPFIVECNVYKLLE